MIELIPKQNKHMAVPPMMKYFFFTEADEDEKDQNDDDENTDDVKAEVTPIKIDGRRGGIGKKPPDQQKPPPEPEPAPEEDPPPEDNPEETTPEPVGEDDIAADDDDDLPAPPDEAPEDDPDDTTTDTAEDDDTPPPPDETSGDASDDTPSEGDTQDSADTDAPDDGGGDETAEVDEVSVGDSGGDDDIPAPPDSAPEGGESAPDDTGGDPAAGEEGGDGDEDLTPLDEEDTETVIGASGATRKYNLYRDFLSLYNSTKSYIERLERSRPDSLEANIVINSSLDKLRKACTSMAEYMAIRFEDARYDQSMMFYQQLIATVRLCFSLIRNNKPFLDQTAHIEDLEKANKKSGNKH